MAANRRNTRPTPPPPRRPCPRSMKRNKLKMTDKILRQLEKIEETKILNNRIAEAAECINRIFRKYNIDEEILKEEICFTDQTLGGKIFAQSREEVGDETIVTFNRNHRLSEIIFSKYFPEPSNSTFVHFTSFPNAESIITKKELWLFNLIKRSGQDEYVHFFDDHNLKGLGNKKAPDGTNMYISILKEIFYTSFAHSTSLSDSSSERLWRNFGDNGCGIRLEFSITPLNDVFRHMFYKSDTQLNLLINDISEAIKERFNRVFVVAGISKIGGFYLPEGFAEENEVRLLIKKKVDDYVFNFEVFDDTSVPDSQFIKLRFDDNGFVMLRLLTIQPGKCCSVDKLSNLNFENYDNSEKPVVLDKSKI
jgi:hypothetical protein